MLEKFAAEVPDVDSKRSVIGEHSNDAHTLSVLLAGRDEFISKHFHAFWLHESGFQGATCRSRHRILEREAAQTVAEVLSPRC